MENIFKQIEKRYVEFYEKEIKSDLYYAVAYDEDDNYLGEVNGHESYCEDCKLSAYDTFNDKLKEDRNELNINICESQYNDVEYIKMVCEGSPERDDFETCETCGETIYTGVLHTFTQEIDYYLEEDLNLSKISNSDCYRLHEILQNHEDLVLVSKLRLKIIEDNKL